MKWVGEWPFVFFFRRASQVQTTGGRLRRLASGGNNAVFYTHTHSFIKKISVGMFESRLLVTQKLEWMRLLLLVMRIFGFSYYRRAGLSSISSIHVFRCDQATWLKLTSSFDEPNHRFVETKQKRKHTYVDEGRRKGIDQDIAVGRNDWSQAHYARPYVGSRDFILFGIASLTCGARRADDGVTGRPLDDETPATGTTVGDGITDS